MPCVPLYAKLAICRQTCGKPQTILEFYADPGCLCPETTELKTAPDSRPCDYDGDLQTSQTLTNLTKYTCLTVSKAYILLQFCLGSWIKLFSMFPRVLGHLVYQPSAWQTFHNIINAHFLSQCLPRMSKKLWVVEMEGGCTNEQEAASVEPITEDILVFPSPDSSCLHKFSPWLGLLSYLLTY